MGVSLNFLLTDAQKPGPSACYIDGRKSIWHDGMEPEQSTPDIEGIVAVI